MEGAKGKCWGREVGDEKKKKRTEKDEEQGGRVPTSAAWTHTEMALTEL